MNLIKNIYSKVEPFRKIIVLIVGLFLFVKPCRAQENYSIEYDSAYMAGVESLMVQIEKEQKVRDVLADYEVKMLKHEMSFQIDGIGSLLRGGIDTWRRNGFYKNETTWHQRGDDYLDYGLACSPLVLSLGLKMAGVSSRSSTQRMAVANSMALGLSIGVSTLWKNAQREVRPNKSGSHGMPSRHAAVAFSCATILHREYGYLSPFVSVGAYSAATMTGIMRLHNNDHWAKDMCVGAGIGTVATNLSYYLTDKILGEKGVNKPKMTMADLQRVYKYNLRPISLSMVSGIESGSNRDDNDVYGTTVTAGLEYSYFTNSHFALELMGRYATTQCYDKSMPEVGYNMDIAHLDAGAKYSWLLSPDTRFACRAFCGPRFLTTTKVDTSDECRMECGAGIGLNFINKEKYAAGINCDYVHTFSQRMTNRFVINAVWQIIL